MVFITHRKCVYSAVRTGSLNIFQVNLGFIGLKHNGSYIYHLVKESKLCFAITLWVCLSYEAYNQYSDKDTFCRVRDSNRVQSKGILRVQIDPQAHPARYAMGTATFPAGTEPSVWGWLHLSV